MVAKAVDRELTGKALAEYARGKGIEKSDWYRISRQELERNILASLLIEDVLRARVEVTDQEIEAAYRARSAEMVQGGKKIPLSAAKEQLRVLLQNEKHRKAFDDYVAALNRKASVTVNDAVLSKA